MNADPWPTSDMVTRFVPNRQNEILPAGKRSSPSPNPLAFRRVSPQTHENSGLLPVMMKVIYEGAPPLEQVMQRTTDRLRR